MIDIHAGKLYILDKEITRFRVGNYMQEFVSTVTSKGRVTIPAEIRKYLGIETNEKLAFVIDDVGIVRLRVLHYPTIASLRGAAGSLKKPLSWQEMQRIVGEDRFDGITRQEP